MVRANEKAFTFVGLLKFGSLDCVHSVYECAVLFMSFFANIVSVLISY